MKCSKCQTENPESKKFCRKCGAKLLKQCPQCGSESLPEDEFCVREEDGDFEIGEKIKKGLGVLRVGESSTLPYFLELLSVKDSGIDRISMSPEGKKDRMIEALKQIALKGSHIRPLVMAIEDLHWVDKSSEDALKYFLESIPGARILLIFTYRPEFVHTWGGRSYHNQTDTFAGRKSRPSWNWAFDLVRISSPGRESRPLMNS